MSKAKLLALLLLSSYSIVSYGEHCNKLDESSHLGSGSTVVTIVNNMSETIYYGGENSGGTVYFHGWSGPDPAPLIKAGSSAHMVFCPVNASSGADITMESPKGKSIGTISFRASFTSGLTKTNFSWSCSTNIANSNCQGATQSAT